MMKKVLLIAAFLTFNVCLSQDNEITKTNLQEYLYLTETLKTANDTPILEGYTFKNLTNTASGNFVYDYKLFLDSKKKVKAIYIKITKLKKKDNKVIHLCLPFKNKELFLRFIKKKESLGSSMYIGFNMMNTILLSDSLHDLLNKDTKL